MASEKLLRPSVKPGGLRAILRSLREGMGEVRYFLQYFHGDWSLVAGVIGLSLISTLLRLPLIYLPIVLTKHFEFDDFVDPSTGGKVLESLEQLPTNFLKTVFGSPGYLNAAVLIAIGCILALAPLQLLRSYWAGLVGGNLLLRLRVGIFKNLKWLNMQAVYEQGASPFVQRITRDMLVLHELLVMHMSGLINLLLQVVIFTTVAVLMKPALTLAILVCTILVQPVLFMINARIQVQAKRIQELHEGVTERILESVGGYRDIIAAGHFDKMSEKFRGTAANLRIESIRTLLWSQGGELILNVAFGTLTVLPYFLLVGRLHSIEQVGSTITYVGLLSNLLPALSGLWGATVELSHATPSMQALHYLLTPLAQGAHFAVSAGERAVPPSEIRSIRFENVGLKMDERWIVRDLNFEIQGGKLTILIGESGAGKTTIFHLLLRLIQPTTGTIWINDQKLSDFDELDLRRLVGFIPQNPFLFKTSLRENLLVAADRPAGDGFSIDEVVQATQLGGLIEARREEGGLDSSAGYLGMRLSGGERQRIALGRLLVQNPSIIVCDEYTANIDVHTAQLIQDMMRERFAGRTRLVITHELYNARGADQIVVLDHGRVVESGTHPELVGREGLYRSMWEAQRID